MKLGCFHKEKMGQIISSQQPWLPSLVGIKQNCLKEHCACNGVWPVGISILLQVPNGKEGYES
jgi:hypothetical protein